MQNTEIISFLIINLEIGALSNKFTISMNLLIFLSHSYTFSSFWTCIIVITPGFQLDQLT